MFEPATAPANADELAAMLAPPLLRRSTDVDRLLLTYCCNSLGPLLRGVRILVLFADRARQSPVQREPFPPGGLLPGLQLVWDTHTLPEVHLARRLASKGGVRESLVVFRHVEPDEALDGFCTVERVWGS